MPLPFSFSFSAPSPPAALAALFSSRSCFASSFFRCFSSTSFPASSSISLCVLGSAVPFFAALEVDAAGLEVDATALEVDAIGEEERTGGPVEKEKAVPLLGDLARWGEGGAGEEGGRAVREGSEGPNEDPNDVPAVEAGWEEKARLGSEGPKELEGGATFGAGGRGTTNSSGSASSWMTRFSSSSPPRELRLNSSI